MRIASSTRPNPTVRIMTHAMSGAATSFTASHHACAASGASVFSMRIAAPTERSPAGSDDCPRRENVWSAKPGIGNPAALHAKPATVESSSGFVAISRAKPRSPCCASIATARKLTSGIIAPRTSAASATPGVPKRLPAMASPM